MTSFSSRPIGKLRATEPNTPPLRHDFVVIAPDQQVAPFGCRQVRHEEIRGIGAWECRAPSPTRILRARSSRATRDRAGARVRPGVHSIASSVHGTSTARLGVTCNSRRSGAPFAPARPAQATVSGRIRAAARGLPPIPRRASRRAPARVRSRGAPRAGKRARQSAGGAPRRRLPLPPALAAARVACIAESFSTGDPGAASAVRSAGRSGSVACDVPGGWFDSDWRTPSAERRVRILGSLGSICPRPRGRRGWSASGMPDGVGPGQTGSQVPRGNCRPRRERVGKPCGTVKPLPVRRVPLPAADSSSATAAAARPGAPRRARAALETRTTHPRVRYPSLRMSRSASNGARTFTSLSK